MAWSGTGISDTCLSEQGYVTVPDEAYKNACVTTWEQGLEISERIGFPIMIKASEGGGGKGIRMVDSAEKFKNAFQAVAVEVPGKQTAKGDPNPNSPCIRRFADFHHEACRLRPTLGGAAHCRSVW